jgi:hypothetical protein
MAKKAEAKLSKEEMAALRAEVKSEAKVANKKGTIADGDGASMIKTAESKLTKEEMAAVRAMVKAEAVKAVKNDTIKTGEK